MTELRYKDEAAMSSWFAQLWTSYFDDMIAAGIGEVAAQANINGNRERLFVDDRLGPGQHVFDLVDEGVDVGTLWLAEPGVADPVAWYVYDIVIDEPHRGRGCGRRAMEAAERFVRDAGGQRLALNVFGPNTVARNLYESLEFHVVAQFMAKDL